MSLPEIPMISIDMTDRCNLRCLHCRSALGVFEPTTESLVHFVEEISRLSPKIVVLSGGEPLMHAGLLEVVAAICKTGAAAQVNTNGLLLDRDMAEQLAKAGVDYVQVSLEGPARAHDAVRGPGSWAKAVDACRLIVDPVKLIVNTTVSRFNLPYLDELAQQILVGPGALDLYLWGLKRYVPFNRLADEHTLGPDGLSHLVYTWKQLQRRYPDSKIKTDIPQTNLLQVDRVREVMAKYQMQCGGCSAGVECLTVRANGDVAPCPTVYLSLGNLNEQSIEEVMLHPLIGSFASREDHQGRCKSCESRMICGGCRALALIRYGDVLAEDPECYEGDPRPCPELAAAAATDVSECGRQAAPPIGKAGQESTP